jgi:cold shock CspA family protein
VSDRKRGTVRWYDRKSGFGYIATDNPGEREVYLHVNELRRAGIKFAEVGDVLSFAIGDSTRRDRRNMAVDISVAV